MVNTNIVEVKNLEVVIVTLFFGFLFILIILLIAVIIYYCIKRNKPKGTPKIAPAALVAAVIGRVSVKTESSTVIILRIYPRFTYRAKMKMNI